MQQNIYIYAVKQNDGGDHNRFSLQQSGVFGSGVNTSTLIKF